MWIAVAALLLASCGGGGGGGPTPEPPNGNGNGATGVVWFYTYPTGEQWVVAPPVTAQPASGVTMAADGQIYTFNARDDGSFYYTFAEGGVLTVSVNYTDASGNTKNVTATPFSIEQHLTHDFVLTGAAPNDMVFANDCCYIVNSMDNNMSIYDTADFTRIGGMTFPEWSSPSYIVVGAEFGFVACNGNNTIYAFDPADGTEQWSVQLESGGLAFLGPGRLWANEDYVFVPLANIYEFGQAGDETLYNPAQVAVIGIESHLMEFAITLSGENAVEIAPVGEDLLAISQAGNVSFDEDYNPFVTTTSFIDVYSLDTMRIVESVSLGVVGAGTLLYDEERSRLLVGSLVNGRAYEISTESWAIERGRTNPIRIGTGKTFISDMVLTEDALLAASFNEDAIFALDLEDYAVGVWPLPAPLSLEQETLFLAGPQELYYDGTAGALLILEGVANRIARFDLP